MSKAPANGAVPCPLCKASSRYVFTAGDRFYQVTDYSADLFRCEDCGARFQWPIPTRDQVASFYPQGYWMETDNHGVLARLQQFYVKTLLRWDPVAWVRRLKLPPGAAVLDVGCSRGDWLNAIAKLGLCVAGVEADPRAAAYARKHFGLKVEEVAAEAWQPVPAKWDAILFFHLLEHLVDPDQFLNRCATALRPGGKLLCRVPNIAAWQATCTGARWKGLEIPRHIHLYTPKALRRLFQRHGFQILTQSTWSLRDGPPAWTSSLFPSGEPTRQAIRGESKPLHTVAYLGLNGLITPLEALAAACGYGGMITVIATHQSNDQPF